LLSEPIWLSVRDIIDTNLDEVSETNEPHFLRDHALLESAIDRAANTWHYGGLDIFSCAASLISGLAQNHPFEQGNKRTALTAGMWFLAINGFTWTGDTGQEVAQVVLDHIEHKIDESELADYLRRGCGLPF
jgi:death-on-curing protein